MENVTMLTKEGFYWCSHMWTSCNNWSVKDFYICGQYATGSAFHFRV